MDSVLNSGVKRKKPTIGLIGTIGAGKSAVAKVFSTLGWCVSDSDALAHAAFRDPAIRKTLVEWWGEGILSPDGQVNRARVAAIVFSSAGASPEEFAACDREREALEELTHPWIHNQRHAQFAAAPADCVGFVIDAPLLLESGLAGECSDIVLVDAPAAVRLARVSSNRGWGEAELRRRESAQMPLDLKAKRAHHVVVNDADLESLRARVARIHSIILEGKEKDRSASR